MTSILTEGTDNLYHYTHLGGATTILKTGNFHLSGFKGNENEEKYAAKGYHFYMSASRSKVGDYHMRTYGNGVMFNLDGRWINQRYPTAPIDYWERMWLQKDGNPPTGRASEMEDRIYSKDPEMPITPIQEIHVYFDDRSNKDWKVYVKSILIEARKKQIPVYFYNDEKHWLAQDKRKALDTESTVSSLKLDQPVEKYSGMRRKNTYMASWLELYHKKATTELSEKARKLKNGIVWYTYGGQEDHGLKNDMFNGRKPGSYGHEAAVSIYKIMRKEKMVRFQDLVDHIEEKWKAINKVEDEATKLAREPATESIITEANQNSVILVDFQPAYSSDDWGYTKALEKAMHYLNTKQPNVLCYFNGEDVGIEDTPEDVYYHFVEHGLNEDQHHNIEFKEKSYAFLRNWMDIGIDHSLIIKTLRYMVMNDVHDTREIDDEIFDQIAEEDPKLEDREIVMYLPESVNIASLKALSGSLIGGGGRHECLKEIQLVMNAFNIKYKMVDDWIYG